MRYEVGGGLATGLAGLAGSLGIGDPYISYYTPSSKYAHCIIPRYYHTVCTYRAGSADFLQNVRVPVRRSLFRPLYEERVESVAIVFPRSPSERIESAKVSTSFRPRDEKPGTLIVTLGVKGCDKKEEHA